MYCIMYCICSTGVELDGGGGEEGETEREKSVPDLSTQKEEIRTLLNQRLKKGDTWYKCVYMYMYYITRLHLGGALTPLFKSHPLLIMFK